MATGIINLQLKLNPELNAKQMALQLNALIKQLKSGLGPLAKGITPIDLKGFDKDIALINKQFRDTANEAGKVKSSTDGLTSTLKNATGQASALSKAFQFNQVAQSLQVATQAFAPFLNEFVEFDKQIKNIGTLGVQNFQAYEPLLTDLAAKIPGTAADMANGVYQAISAGVEGSAQDVVNFVEVAAKAGVAGMTSTSAAVDGLTSVINAYGKEVSDAGAVADTFFSGVKLGKTSFEEMNSTLATFVPSASAMGVSFEQATAAIARYTALGTPTAQVGTQMNAVFTLLAKGTAPLTKALEANGTSLDVLREKLKQPVEAGGGLVNVMREIKLAADNSGQQLAALTGRVEAAKIIESLAGDTDKYTESLKTFGRVQEEIQAGAAEQAFQVAATSVSAQTDGYLATVQGVFNATFSAIGSGATSALNTLTQLSPALISISSAVSLIPVGSLVSGFASAGASAAQFATSLLARVIPGLAATNAASVAGATGFRAMWLAATGPIGLIVAGLGAVAAGAYFLYDALVETKEEQLEATKAQEEFVQGQIKANETAQNQIKTNENLVANYQRLGKETKLTAAEQENLDKTIIALSKAYPGVVDSTKSYEDNMKALNAAAKEEQNELKNLQDELDNLTVKAGETSVARLNLEADIQSEELADKLNDEMTRYVNVNGKGELSSKIVDGYVDTIQNAQKSGDVRKAVVDFSSALYSSEAFKDVPPEVKSEVLKNIKELGEQRNAVIDEQNKLNLEQTNQALKSLVAQQNSDINFEISDDSITNIAQQFNQTEEQVRASLEKMQDDARGTKIDEILKESFTINQEIDKQGRIEELLDQYKSAGTEIEKANISAKIADLAPDAVKATGTIKDANGDLVQTYEVLEDQVISAGEARTNALSGDLLTKQKQIVGEIQKEGQGYENNKQKLQEIQDQINQAQSADPNFDTTELFEKYNQIKARNEDTQSDIIETARQWVVTGNDADLVYKQVADSLGIPVEEAKNLVDESLKAKDAVEEIKEETDSLGESFNKALGEARKSYQENVNALAGLYGDLREAEESSDKERINAVNEQIKNQKALNKESKAQLDLKEADLKRSKSLTEQEKKKGDTAFQAAEKIFKAEEKRIKNQQESFEIDQEMNIILQEREKTQFDDLKMNQQKLSSLEQQKKSLLETFKLIENEDGTVEFGMRLKKEERAKLQDQVISINNQISKQENSVLKIESQIELKEAEVEEKLREFERKNLEFQISIGIKSNDDLLKAVQSDLDSVQNQIDNKKLSLLDPEVTKESSLQIKEELIELQNQEIELLEETASIKNAISDKELADVKNYNEAILEEERKRVDKELSLRNVLIDSTAGFQERKITSDLDGDLVRLEEAREAELITEEAYNRKKEELEQNHQKRLQAIQAVANGERFEAQRQAEIEDLKAKEEALLREISVIEKTPADERTLKQEEELRSFRNSLAQTESDIANKTDAIAHYGEALSENLATTFSNIGDPEAMRNGFRNMFGTIAGALKAQASALATQKILEQLSLTPGGLPSLLLAPILKGVISSLIGRILDPILNNLLSFSTGGRVDQPTVAVVGDASKSRPGADTEWILRDDQITWIINQALSKNNLTFAGIFSNEITRVVDAIRTSDQMLHHTLIHEFAHLYSANELKAIAFNMNSGVSEMKNFMSNVYANNDKNTADNLIKNFGSSYTDFTNQKITKKEYDNSIRKMLNSIPSYAGGSGFISEPQVALIGDAGANNPEIVQNKNQLQEMLLETSYATASAIVKPLEKKMDTFIDVLINKEMGITRGELFDNVRAEQASRKSRKRG